MTATPRAVQERLRALGYYNGRIDGNLGGVSLAAMLAALEGVGAKKVEGVRQVSAGGLKLITQREGKRLRAYLDSRGIWTIGVGHTAAAGDPAPRAGMVITEAECSAILDRDLDLFERGVADAVTVPIEQHEFDALVSLAFNIGETAFAKSSLVRKLNAGDRAGAANAFLNWKRAGKDPNILLSRRQAERLQFLGA